MGKDLQNIKEQTSERKLTTHFDPIMIEGADKIVTKCSTNSRNEQRVDRRVGG